MSEHQKVASSRSPPKSRLVESWACLGVSSRASTRVFHNWRACDGDSPTLTGIKKLPIASLLTTHKHPPCLLNRAFCHLWLLPIDKLKGSLSTQPLSWSLGIAFSREQFQWVSMAPWSGDTSLGILTRNKWVKWRKIWLYFFFFNGYEQLIHRKVFFNVWTK